MEKQRWEESEERSQFTFGSWNDEKVHAVVARSTFPSQNPEHFWKLRCRKNAVKHISKSSTLKIDGPGPLLDIPKSEQNVMVL